MDSTGNMENNLEYIENYFKGIHTDVQKKEFEKKIVEDAGFAEEVAFYVSANGVIREQMQDEKRQRFRKQYEEGKVVPMSRPVKMVWRYLAAASIIAVVLLASWFFLGNKNSPQQLAETYVQQNWQTLSVTMGSSRDSLQTGLDLFNSNKLSEALTIFESLAKSNGQSDDAIKDAGITSLRLGNYDKALNYFSALETDTSLFSNPGKFYKAITFLKRNQNGDKEAARLLLQEVKDKNLEGKNEAVEWLKKL